ncbi:MAG TPA: hypothetical protein GX521_08815 [Firmicutes bacterium]|nr:hypothetical protein [Bacillota bacterium]
MPVKVRKQTFVLFAVLTIFLAANAVVMAVGVRPLVIEMNVRPGDQREFEIHLTPGMTEELVDLTLYEPVQQLSGSLIYQLPTNPAFSATSWVTLEDEVVRVPPDAEGKVKGTLRVPYSAGGSHTVIIMVEPRPPEITSGIGFQVRYAVRLSIKVEKAGVRPTAEMTALTVEPNQQGLPQVTALFKNTSALEHVVSGEVTIRDQERRLVERVTLRTPAGASSNSDTTRIYPGAEVKFMGTITRHLIPGEYTLQVFFRYGESGQILHSEPLIINEGDYDFPGFDELGAVAVLPALVEHELRAGENKSQIFEFENIMGVPVRLKVELGEIMPDYKYSLTEWLLLRSQDEFVIPARAKTRLAMTVVPPRQIEEGSYHGRAIFKAFDARTNEFLSEAVVPINVFIGDVLEPAVKVRSVTWQATEENQIYFSIDITNSGNMAFTPVINGVIRNEAGEYVERIRFELQEGKQVFPLQNLRAEGYASLANGSYSLEIEVGHGSNIILTELHEVLVNYPVDEQ